MKINDDIRREFKQDGGLVFFPRHKIVWGKVPRTGSTSLLQVFKLVWGKAVTLKHDPENYLKILDKTSVELEDWFPIVFVGDPFKRFASLYTYAKRPDVGWIAPDRKFREFVEQFETLYSGRAKRAFYLHAKPASAWMKIGPRFIGCQESIEHDAANIIRHFAECPIDDEGLCPFLNQSPQYDWRDLYRGSGASKSIKLVLDFYGDDFSPCYRVRKSQAAGGMLP